MITRLSHPVTDRSLVLSGSVCLRNAMGSFPVVMKLENQPGAAKKETKTKKNWSEISAKSQSGKKKKLKN